MTVYGAFPGARRLKVLFITISYPTKESPIDGIFVREHAKAVRLYDDVAVLHLAGPKANLGGLWRLEEETDHKVTERVPTYRLWTSSAFDSRFAILDRAFGTIKICYAFLAFKVLSARTFRPDIIHAHIYGAGFAAVLIGRIHRIPVVVTEQFSSIPMKELSLGEIFKAWIAFKAAKKVLPVSRALQKGIEDYAIHVPFEIIPNVVDTTLFSLPSIIGSSDGEKRLLFVGLLDPVKGLPYLFHALARLRCFREDWLLDIVGDGPARREYTDLVARLGLSDKVAFLGLKTKAEVAQIMRRSDLFVLPSMIETFGCVLIEAMATGLPIVASDSGAIPELVDSECGFLAKPKDPDDICEKLNMALENLSKFDRKRISEKVSSLYSYESIGRRFHDVYLSVLGRPSG